MSCFIQSTLLVPILFLSLCFLAFIFCLEKPCFGAGISTLVLQLYKGYRTRVSIQGSIYLVSPLFYGLCQRVSWASLWSVVRFLEYFLKLWSVLPSFPPITLTPRIEGKWRNVLNKGFSINLGEFFFYVTSK